MADEQKTVVAEPVAPAADAAPTDTKPVEATPEAAAEAKPDAEAPAATTEAPPTAEEPAKAAEEPAKEAPKEVDPIYKGTLKYASGNPIKAVFSKPTYHFYFGEAAVKAEDLKHTVKLQEAGGRETAAWSNETGNGILYYVREAASKTGPPGAVLLHAIEDLKKVGTDKIHFKLHGSQHQLYASNSSDRDGWYKALEEKIEEAKSLKDEIVNKDSFKETLEKLTKPTGLVLGTAAAGTAVVQENMPKKSVEERKEERKARSEAKKEAKASKDRSQSRGKKFFEQFRAKKAAEEPKPSTEEAAKPEDEAAAAEPATATDATDAVEPAAETPAAPVEAAAETVPAEAPKTEEKKARRSSKFLDRIKALGSPTQEKKPEEVAPAVEEAPAAEPAAAEPATEAPETEAAVVTDAEPATNGEPAAEDKPADVAAPPEKQERRRSSFFDFSQLKFPGKGKKVETAAKDEPAAEDAKAEDAKPAEGTEATTEAAAAETTETTETKEPAPKTEKKSATANLIGLIRSGSKAIRGNREGKKAKTPEKVEETKAESAAVEESKTEEEAKPEEPAVPETKEETPAAPTTIGDVVAEAVSVGTPAPAASQTVTASA